MPRLLQLGWSTAPAPSSTTTTVSAIAAPSVVLEVPAGTGRAVVRNRQPILRGLLKANVATTIDTTATVLTWRGTR